MNEPQIKNQVQASRKSVHQNKDKAPSNNLPEKASERSLYIRRAIEDHFEEKQLESLSDDGWWDNI